MSQLCWTNNGYDIMVGWDRPLQYYFLVIEKAGAADRFDDTDLVYSNLDDLEYGPSLPLEVIALRLDEYGITPPDSLWFDLRHDQATQRMNHRHNYGVIA